MPTTVFFATNRRRTGNGTRPEHYAGETGPAGQPGRLTFGQARVSTPDLAGLTPGQLEELSRIAEDDMDAAMQDDLAGGRNLLIFLHGFANSFTDSITRAAFNRDWLAASGVAGADCTVASFSWPSQGVTVNPGDVVPGTMTLVLSLAILALTGHTDSPLANAYRADQRAAETSAGDIVGYLDRLRPVFAKVRRGGGRVFLLAHSMGNFALQSALQQWDAQGLPRAALFDEAISVAADTAWAEGGGGPAWLRALRKVSGRVSLYHSAGDDILRLSQVVNGTQRLGRSGPIDRTDVAAYPPATFRLVDCSGVVDTGPGQTIDSGHQYYRRVPAVRDDMARILDGKGRGGRSVLV